jgi:ubiquinol-cytochrome c reductase cytochrome c1 subunit
MINKNLIKIFILLLAFFISAEVKASGGNDHLLKTDWSFKGIFGKFDRASLQ